MYRQPGAPPPSRGGKKAPIACTDGSDVRTIYAFGNELGRGNYGKVRLCMDIFAGGPQLACKTVPHAKGVAVMDASADVYREIEVLGAVAGHSNIVELQAVHRDTSGVHLVMELCQGGELFDEVIGRGRFAESDAALTFCQLASAIDYCHQMKIFHRDIKLENILISSPPAMNRRGERLRTGPVDVKLADFGLAVVVDDEDTVAEVAGSPYYMAPEIVLGHNYGLKADVWSLGVILYCLLSGLLPFTGPTNLEIFKAIRRAYIDLDTPAWEGVSDAAKSLVQRMLHPDPRRRPSAAEVIRDPWVVRALIASGVTRDLGAVQLEQQPLQRQQSSRLGRPQLDIDYEWPESRAHPVASPSDIDCSNGDQLRAEPVNVKAAMPAYFKPKLKPLVVKQQKFSPASTLDPHYALESPTSGSGPDSPSAFPYTPSPPTSQPSSPTCSSPRSGRLKNMFRRSKPTVPSDKRRQSRMLFVGTGSPA